MEGQVRNMAARKPQTKERRKTRIDHPTSMFQLMLEFSVIFLNSPLRAVSIPTLGVLALRVRDLLFWSSLGPLIFENSHPAPVKSLILAHVVLTKTAGLPSVQTSVSGVPRRWASERRLGLCRR